MEKEPLDASGTGNGAGISRADCAGRRAAVAAVRRAEWTKHRIGQWFVYGDERGLRDGACSRRYWNDFFRSLGQLTLLLLIQIGGLGFMAFATLTMMLLGRKIGLRDRMLLRESMNTSGLSGLVRLTRWYLTAALVIEGGGAVLLAIRFRAAAGLGEGRVLQHLPRRQRVLQRGL